jgi:hypothetical protein
MRIVRLALRRPYTFVVVALLLLLMTPFVVTKRPTDIFLAINIQVISLIWELHRTAGPSDRPTNPCGFVQPCSAEEIMFASLVSKAWRSLVARI